ncbi:MAG: ComF family protein [Verrucomicrobiae bacterium]|nr:ComF family protein [Verrucomicrobiae bacterium]
MKTRFMTLLGRAAREGLDAVIDLLYPRQCQICGATERCTRFAFVCDDCHASAPRIQPPCCERCGMPFSSNLASPFTCANCHDITLHFDRAVAAMRFHGAVRQAVHALKYRGQAFWTQLLCDWMNENKDRLLDPADFDVIIPIPLHPVRERERGFNQARLLAEELGRQWNKPLLRKALIRQRPTETQTHLDRQERQANLRGAFAAKAPLRIRGQRCLLVDDVLTTGSTASECARVLREAGAVSILVFTLARG